MKKIEFKTSISAPAKKVWDTMLAPQTYKEWVGAGWPNSDYKGKWSKGEKISFGGEGQGGTIAMIDEFKPYETILARHVAIINMDGSEDVSSPVAQGWVGTLERYTFNETKGSTTLTVTLNVSPEWEQMFQEGWPAALKALKNICEN